MIMVAKPGKIPIHLDHHELNKVIQHPKYQMPTLEELLPKLCKAKIFSLLDATHGFYQISVDEASSKLITFWMPFGRYCNLLMPFGISLASEEFESIKPTGETGGLRRCRSDLRRHHSYGIW